MGIKEACQMLISLGINSRNIYVMEFEQPFLAETAEFYTRKGQTFLELKNASAYIKEVEQCLGNETSRAQQYLDAETETKLLGVLVFSVILRNNNSRY